MSLTRRLRRHLAGAIFVLVALVSAAPAAAQSESQNNTQKSSQVFRWDNHPSVHIGDLRVSFRARVQVDSRRSDAPLTDEDEVNTDFARKRIGIDGQFGRYVEFQVERELDDDLDPWRDVYANYRQFTEAQFQYGKFKLPFSLDENTSPTNLDFVYRSLAASTLAPGRDIGWMAHGRVIDQIVRYEFGIFEHDGANAKPRRAPRVIGGQTKALRLGVQPFRTTDTPAEDLLLGVAWTWSDLEEGLPGVRGQTVFGRSFFSSDYAVVGKRNRMGFEMRWRPGPFSVKSEYMTVTDERLGLSVEDTDLSPIRAIGWYVSGTWAITGEKKADGLDSPDHPLFQGGFGAIEVAARVERLTFDSGNASETPSLSPRAEVILGNSNKVITLGASWYLNRWVKIQFNLIQETLTDPEQGPLPDRNKFWSRVLRFQFSL
jgi:phosphate-selective porin